MRIIFFLLLILINFSFVNSDTLICDFEEVHKNSQTQIGQILISSDSLRYEYYEENLYTALFVNQKLFIIENFDNNKVQEIAQSNILIESLLKISNDYPNISEQYNINEMMIKTEKSEKGYLKRISIVSPEYNLSVYFINCERSPVDRMYFNFNPFIKYVRN